MKKIINGKKYDTETAIEIAQYWNHLSPTDFANLYEKLYRKKTGEYFLFGEGGPMTKYAKSCGSNSWCSGKAIIPLTLKEAKEWVEEYENSSYEEIFGETEE